MNTTKTYLSALLILGFVWLSPRPLRADNPIITDAFTADPAALVVGDTVYLYCGQDEGRPDQTGGYVLHRWLCYSSTDLVNWRPHGSPLAAKDFTWAKGSAWASHVVERNGKFYWYSTVDQATAKGFAVGVAVSDSPTGPFKDARGSALVSLDHPGGKPWDDIDPAVFIDAGGQAWLFWGNTTCYYARLKPNMIELDGDVQTVVGLHDFTEAPWVHQRNGIYYLSYASGFPEKISYATAPAITGPWTHRGILAEVAGNSNTIHQAIIDFKGRSYFIYHNGGRQRPDIGGSFRRSVCVDELFYNADGTMKPVIQTSEGVK
ncbi:MAG TPA: glycoside hydrolase family 43 protein [Tepidisphaeraceae bacterium]|jgi:beta-xylosidase